MHDLFLVPLHAIDDALKQLKLDTQQIQTLATLRSSLEAAFEYCKAFCRDNKDAFDQVLNRR
jgi:hypothetical protein